MRYFASQTPHVALYCGSGGVIRWPSPNGGEGMLQVGDEATLGCLQTCISTGTGGVIREVTAQEFEDWQKKTAGQRPIHLDRESYSGGVVRHTASSPSSSQSPNAALVAVAEVKAVPTTAPPQVQDSGQPATVVPNIPTRRRGAVSP